MMGRQKSDQGQLFYSFCLDEVVPDDHRWREFAAVLNLSWVHSELAAHYSHLGRQSKLNRHEPADLLGSRFRLELGGAQSRR